jgi:hypothetical protein
MFSLVADGCRDHMLNYVPAIVDAMLGLTNDPEFQVRYWVRIGLFQYVKLGFFVGSKFVVFLRASTA